MNLETRFATPVPSLLPECPRVPGFTSRRWAGPADYAAMASVLAACREADGADWLPTAEELSWTYANLPGCIPSRDVLLVERGGAVIGYRMVRASAEQDGTAIYSHAGWVVPAWRRHGLGGALLRHSEAHIRRIAAIAGAADRGFLQAVADDHAPDRHALLARAEYAPVRYAHTMVRRIAEPVPEAALPPGLEVRPVEPGHYRAIWAAEAEAFRDHWGTTAADLADFDRWLAQPWFQPYLWQVAWDGCQVAGMVRNFVAEEENATFGRRRGYTEQISVRRPWRRRGVARALLARSIRLHADLGMSETALSVDTENPTGALELYTDMGYRTVRRHTFYRKPLR